MNQYVAFSGGVDSTALALTETNATVVFTDTGDEFDEIYAHIEKFERTTGRQVVRVMSKEGTLPDYEVEHKFLPNHGARFCTRIFKIEAYNDWLTSGDHLPAEMLIGLRADEPEDMRVGNLTKLNGLTIRYPLREQGWIRADCIRKCLEFDLLPRYPVYMARGGCKGCFYKRKSEVMAMIHLRPDIIDELQAREEAVQDARGSYFHMFPNAGASIRDLRQHTPLIDMSEVYADSADSSDKGAACGLLCHR